MGVRASVLVYGATGFTGQLVCDALRRQGTAFAIAGRSRGKLEKLAEGWRAEGGDVEVEVVAPGDADSLRRSVEGRSAVCACAGPFLSVGEPMLATCARLGVHYVDTTGEQAFVARAVTRYRATAEGSRACIVPAMAYEIALADWAAHLATERVGGSPDSIDILYALRGGGGTSRGTKRSALAQIGAGDAMQFVEGVLRRESPAAVRRAFQLTTGRKVMGASFPSPEAIVVPSHTAARTVRTFMPVGRVAAKAMQILAPAVPFFSRMVERAVESRIARSPDGPDTLARQASTFEVIAEARRGSRVASVHVTGRDPYGLTAQIQAYAVREMLGGGALTRGVVAPSVAFDPHRALEALAAFGVIVS